jgi:pantetheine-phosphate adenylyltransferase
MSKKAIYAGTFDPFTKGHEDILEKGLKIFDEVILLISVPPNKKAFLEVEKRVSILQKLYSKNDRVKVDHWGGLLAEYASEKKVGHLIRGLRSTSDFNGEFQMSCMNRVLNKSLETCFFVSEQKFLHISSSLVREIWGHGGDISSFVPGQVLDELKK